MEIKKNQEKNKNKLRIISPKNHENFKDSKPRVVLLVLIKKSVLQQEEGNHYSVIKGVLYRSDDATCFFYYCFQSKGPFVYKVINKTKLSITNFQKQSPKNIKESLNNTNCTYNTPCIFFHFI